MQIKQSLRKQERKYKDKGKHANNEEKQKKNENTQNKEKKLH